MSKPVLFATGLGKPIERAENMKALYDAYDGEKVFLHMGEWEYDQAVHSGDYALQVIDIFPAVHPLKTVMMWHSIQGGKYIGLDQKGTYYRPEYAEYIDLIIAAGSGYGREMWKRCTGVPLDRIVDLGMPRTDRYIGKKKGDGHTVLANKKAYLYVPTFRNWDETPLPMIDWKWLDEQLSDDELLAIKYHPYGGSPLNFEGCKHIIRVSGMEPSVNYLYDADVVITDYSSILFDAYLLKKPVVLFEKNPGYTETRGMYLEYPKGYGKYYATDEQELLNTIRTAKSIRLKENRYIRTVADACDGHSCERICELIDEMKG